jgi:hypothetical protein
LRNLPARRLGFIKTDILQTRIRLVAFASL